MHAEPPNTCCHWGDVVDGEDEKGVGGLFPQGRTLGEKKTILEEVFISLYHVIGTCTMLPEN